VRAATPAPEITSTDRDTIAAVATAAGRAAIGVLRVSGPRAAQIAAAVVGVLPERRRAALRNFRDRDGRLLDRGVVLYFPGPGSFTGEDVVELQGHGGPVVLDLLLETVLAMGARLARPGEFSERAFLNGRLDLAQAEAVADLIASASAAAARNAARSLVGEFSHRIDALASRMLEIRTYVEAAIDFPEEEIDFLADSGLAMRVEGLRADIQGLLAGARQGVLQNEGIHVAIAGRPNAGKSSLLNRLAGHDRAIVTDVPGTTRDVLAERIVLGGLPLRVADTAGLRATHDTVEREGVRRARAEIAAADRVLLVVDVTTAEDALRIAQEEGLPLERLSIVLSKADLDASGSYGLLPGSDPPAIRLSALTGAGIDALTRHLQEVVGYREDEGGFSARRRHLDALRRAQMRVESGLAALREQVAGELLAEDLRLAHDALGEIVGQVTSDDLLSAIFASFCIGK
jgi:tRNA modification GTPase